jgi:hypothetical protein
LPKKSSQRPSPALRRLVGQHADRLAALERLEQAAYAGQIGGRQMQLRARPAGFDHRLQPGLPGRPVEDGDRGVRDRYWAVISKQPRCGVR